MNTDEDTFEQRLREAAAAYRQPPETPRHELWLRLEQARAARRPQPLRRKERHPLVWITGIAALLAIGIGLGRLSIRQPAAAPSTAASVTATVATEPPSNVAAYRVTMAEHLVQAEIFLTLFRMSVRRGAVDPLASATARPLLTTNRLLLDSPVGDNREDRALLEDLELVLARIARLSPRPMTEELELITSGMEQTGVMTHLRSQVPAGPGLVSLEGAL